jgi:transposase-like protein
VNVFELVDNTGELILILMQATHSNPAVSRLYSEKLRRADFASFAPPDMLAEYQSLFDRLSSNRLETQEECQEAKTKELWHRPAVVGSTSKGQGSYKWFGKAKNSISALPTEYLAVLITCASRVWMVPKYLHEVNVNWGVPWAELAK